MRANGMAVAKDAAAKARAGTITYQEQDCQSFVENCVAAAGGHMAYAGSNDMFRKTTPVCEIKNGKPLGSLLPGDLLFIHAFDGGEPAKYRADGLGNASHVGIYCGIDGVEAAHSSYTKQRVATSTLKNAWTHARRAKEIDSGTALEAAQEMETGIAPFSGTASEGSIQSPPPSRYFAVVATENGGPVNMRAEPSKACKLYKEVPSGETVLVIGTAISGGRTWRRVERGSRKWYIQADYLRKV